ncbi:unnamed protein product [Rotaria sp. Silwood1]|nr:unnamed protein product [Rotaria sp. Silwood1]CAF1432264.1 unnamed protein product [Rotaria sp. Silwood1]
MTIGTGKFERMTKEEKLRFCRDLIKKAANLTKSSGVSDIYSTGNTSSHSDIYSKSKSNQQPSSVSDTLLKETKNDTLINNGTSKLHSTKRTTSRSSIKSSTSYTSHKSNTSISQHPSISSLLSNKSKNKQQSSASQTLVPLDGSNIIRTPSETSNKLEMKDPTLNTRLATSPKTANTLSGMRSKSKFNGRSKSQRINDTSNIRSTPVSKSQKNKTGTNKLKSTTKTKIASTVLSPSKRSATANKTNVTNIKSKSKSNTKSEKTTGNHQTKKSHKTNKDRTETCTVQFVPKFNPNSNTNQVPIYRLVRHAFGNMVREAICQLDKDKTGVSTQQIIDHIVKHYAFPNNVSESVVRNRAMFTINSGLRAGTLLTVNPNKGVRIGRMRHNYARMLC